MANLLTVDSRGIYCNAGDFYIDPWRPVKRAVITHAHSDHARYGSEKYLSSTRTAPLLRSRLDPHGEYRGVAYGEEVLVNGVKISFHPAGHVPGSAQVRVEHKGEVWVVSGDYKTEDDGVSEPFAPVKCHTFISECTFGLPVYRWKPQSQVAAEINRWWRQNSEDGVNSLLLVYSLGKAQRVLSLLDLSVGSVVGHGAVTTMTNVLRGTGLELPELPRLSAELAKTLSRGSLILAPMSAWGSPWSKKLEPYRAAAASGWMSVRGVRRRRGVEFGFVVSDHADWPGLNAAVEGTGAERVLVTHGYTAPFARWLREKGLDAAELLAEYGGDESEEEA